MREALLAVIEFVPEPEYDLGPAVDAGPYCEGGLEVPAPQFTLESGMLAEGELPEVQLLFGDVTIDGAVIFYTTDGTIPTPCNDPQVSFCNPASQVWTMEDLAGGNSLSFSEDELPVTLIALQALTGCGSNQPVSEINVANYVAFSEIPAPIIYRADVDADPSNDVVVHQGSRIFTRAEVEAMPAGEFNLRFDLNGAGSSAYIRYSTDGRDPLDTTEGNWEDPYGVLPEWATPVYPTQQIATPIWTDYNIDNGHSVKIFDADTPAGTLITVKAQNYVYVGGGPYVGGAVAVESFLMVD